MTLFFGRSLFTKTRVKALIFSKAASNLKLPHFHYNDNQKFSFFRKNKGFFLLVGVCSLATGIGLSAVILAREEKELRYKHVVIGAGVAARACVRELNALDDQELPEGYDGKVLMVGDNSRMNTIGYTDQDREDYSKFLEEPSNTVLMGHYATKLDVQKKTVQLHEGTVVSFDKCFVATGGVYPSLKNVQPSAESHVTTFHRKCDLEHIIDKSQNGEFQHVVVVGGGSLGTEVALELKRRGSPDLKVSQIYAEPGVIHRNLPDYFRAYCTALLRSKGIDQRNFSLVTNVETDSKGKLQLTIDSWDQYTMEADHVIFAPTHIDARNELAVEAGLEIDQNNSGVVVNKELLAFSDVYFGGDVASCPSSIFGRIRVQNYNHARATGTLAARNMLGGREVYNDIPTSEVFLTEINMKHNLVGIVDAKLETVGLWEVNKNKKGKTEDQHFFTSRYNKGVVFYLSEGKIVGMLLTNLNESSHVEKARNIISGQVDYSDLTRQEIELECKEKFKAELNQPLVRSTFSKGNRESKRETSHNPYKNRRHAEKPLTRRPSDTIRDSNTNLYWRSS
ncbi:apoptosis-inducing factor 1, mitochondrial-like isoform X2 [Zophobas morio]|uniref:apoptosis-inducing factor 1, mitochondrial-like isoform X2 n=1 Tax=Zophobas morio TaxID=2755281 RepID=UPI003083CB21